MCRSLSLAVCRLALAAVVATAGTAAADEPPGFGSNDAVQLLAKRALEKEPALKPLNLWVSVRDGVVVVNGGVPDVATAARIETLLATVPGVSVVRVTTWPTTAVDPMKKLVGDKLAGVSNPPNEIRSIPGLAVNPVLSGSVTPPVPALPDGIGSTRAEGTVVVQRVEPVIPGGLLQPPVVANRGTTRMPPDSDVPSMLTGLTPYPTIRATGLPVAPVEHSPVELALALLSVRKSDSRFAGLSAELRNGTATVTGTATNRGDAEAFATAVEKVPGINHVVIGPIRIR